MIADRFLNLSDSLCCPVRVPQMLSGGKANPSVNPVGLLTMTASPVVSQRPVNWAGCVDTRLSKSRRIWQRS